MKQSIFNAVGEFFALDIGSTAVRIVQLRPSGHGFNLVKYGATPVDVKTALSDAPADQLKIGEIISSLITEIGLSTRNVAVGLPSNKTFVTIVDVPKMSPQELASTIKYQADQFIPMAANEAKIDHAVLGDSPTEQGKSEVLLASVTNKFSEQRLEMLEAIGLNVVALEPESLALARALTPLNGSAGGQMIVDIGEYATDIVITLGGAPRLVRTIPTGGQTLIRSAVQNLNIDENQARQFVYKFGLDKTKLEGQIYRALDASVEVIATEVQKSIKFFSARYQNAPINAITTSGAAAVLPGFHQYLSASAGNIPVQAGNSWQNVSYPNNIHEQLMAVNHQFAVAVGLAERSA